MNISFYLEPLLVSKTQNQNNTTQFKTIQHNQKKIKQKHEHELTMNNSTTCVLMDTSTLPKVVLMDLFFMISWHGLILSHQLCKCMFIIH